MTTEVGQYIEEIYDKIQLMETCISAFVSKVRCKLLCLSCRMYYCIAKQ